MFSKPIWMYDSRKPPFYPYLINHSMRLNGTNAYLSKTNFGSSDNTSKRTFSTWIKYCNDVTAVVILTLLEQVVILMDLDLTNLKNFNFLDLEQVHIMVLLT